MGEVVCIDLQGESGDRGVYGSDSQCGGEVFCPKKNIQHYLETFLIVRTVGEHGTAFYQEQARDATKYSIMHRVPQAIPLPEIIGFNMTVEQRLRNLDLEASR